MSLFSNPYPLTDLAAASIDGSTEQGHYDYIVVGGGTAGCVLANRLSEDPDVKVLLLEGGNARLSWATRVPLLSTNFMGDENTAYNWPSAPTTGLADSRSLNIVCGKGLGGGSAINSMNYTRGLPLEYDLWSKDGRKGWSFNEIKDYFKKSEKFVSTPKGTHHGTDGEWIVRDMGDPYFPTAHACVEACVSLGLPYTDDINDPNAPPSVCGKFDCTIDLSGHRNSTFNVFLPQALVSKRKSHLHICTGAVVSALDIEDDANHLQAVKGVSFRAATGTDEKVYHARALREVILCAGAIATPQILLLSGIGPSNKVKKPLKKELLAVGENLVNRQDHLGMGIMYNVPTADSLHIIQKSRLRAIVELFRYIAFGEGLFLAPVSQISIHVDSNRINDSGHIIPSKPTDPIRPPDLEVLPIHFNYSDPPIPFEDGVFSLKVGLMRPASRGSVSLASENPFDRPTCDLAFLTDPADFIVMRKGIKFAKRIGEKMREQGMNLEELYMPDSESDADLDAFVQKTARTTYHYGCTCRMAPENDPRPGVVDDELRVHGISNLRIADCSIFPDILSTHLQAPVVMIAEKCADMIKVDQHRSCEA
ncbi:Oxygen-dependent choline dehydrogenase [Leucoagaricus sp. SymC.cos]|nr:Oxygen-dependent choline dehydrogenase [Leucoagaricus sp. SymC.cos]